MSNWLEEFTGRKIDIAQELLSGRCGGGYPEAIIIISCALSGIASLVWPGERIDRRRFVELMVRYCDPGLCTEYISTPLLVQDLTQSSEPAKNQAGLQMKQKYIPSFPFERLILTGDDADGTEDELLQQWPVLSRTDVRKFSYPNLLYRELRCSLVHNYRLGDSTASIPLFEGEANISYVNSAGEKLIYFHLEWLLKVFRSVCTTVSPSLSALPFGVPHRWWLDGAI